MHTQKYWKPDLPTGSGSRAYKNACLLHEVAWDKRKSPNGKEVTLGSHLDCSLVCLATQSCSVLHLKLKLPVKN